MRVIFNDYSPQNRYAILSSITNRIIDDTNQVCHIAAIEINFRYITNIYYKWISRIFLVYIRANIFFKRYNRLNNTNAPQLNEP